MRQTTVLIVVVFVWGFCTRSGFAEPTQSKEPVYVGNPSQPKAKLKRVRPSVSPQALDAPQLVTKPSKEDKPNEAKKKAAEESKSSDESSANPAE